MALITWHYCTKAEYDAILPNFQPNAVYFLSDTREIMRNGESFSHAVINVTTWPSIGKSGTVYYKASTREAKIWKDGEWAMIGWVKADEITDENSTSTDSIPSIKAVVDYFRSTVPAAVSPARFKSLVIAYNAIVADPDNYANVPMSIYLADRGKYVLHVSEVSFDDFGAIDDIEITQYQEYFRELGGWNFDRSDLTEFDGKWIYEVESNLAPWGVVTHRLECIGMQFDQIIGGKFQIDLTDFIDDLGDETWKIIF